MVFILLFILTIPYFTIQSSQTPNEMNTPNTAPKITNANRADVLRTAWQLVKKTGLHFGEALRRAYVAIRAKLALATSDKFGCFIIYKKADGTTRTAFGTRNPAYIPTDKQPKTGGSGTGLTIPYYDFEAEDWRCFRVDTLLAFSTTFYKPAY